MISPEALYAHFLRHPQVCTDTRKLSPGCLFFALKGESFDGNQFAGYALEQGAAYAIVDDPAVCTSDRHLLVQDVLTTLQGLSTRHRRSFDIPVLAIGGSNGKTTTKELVSAVLSQRYACHSTQGNFNNHIGVPLTLLAMPVGTEIAVIEMGTNHAGDIDLLCQIAEPTHGLLTNIGKEHLEGFGNLQGVKEAEGELYRHLARTKGCAFVNLSEKYLKSMSRGVACRVGYAAGEEHPNNSKIEVKPLAFAPFVRASFVSD
ncbi:MAG TPA: Mur ligase family protein, partial [Saprospiraceae bacterium]|nr:Mur ligase family protein [Saprospiraceae bacterium]